MQLGTEPSDFTMRPFEGWEGNSENETHFLEENDLLTELVQKILNFYQGSKSFTLHCNFPMSSPYTKVVNFDLADIASGDGCLQKIAEIKQAGPLFKHLIG